MDMSEHSIRDLGTFAEMFAKEGYFKMARLYLNEIGERIDAMEGLRGESISARINRQMRPNDILKDLPMVETKEPVLTHKTLAEVAIEKQAETAPAVEAVKIAAEMQPEPGIIRDENGKVTHVSVREGEPGYDPEIHENTALKILCDGVQVENAHTADTIAGVAKYYKKNEQGRIKTLTVHGKIEITGLD